MRILLIEDNELVARVLKLVLKQYKVKHHWSPLNTEILVDWSDLIVCDWRIPCYTEKEMTKFVNKHKHKLIVHSGFDPKIKGVTWVSKGQMYENLLPAIETWKK